MVWYDSLSSLTDENKEVSPLVQAAQKQFCEQWLMKKRKHPHLAESRPRKQVLLSLFIAVLHWRDPNNCPQTTLYTIT